MLQQRTILMAEDFRRVIMHTLLITCIFAIGGYYFAEPLIGYLQHMSGAKLVAYGLPDTVFAFLKIAFAVGATVGMPYTFYRLLAILPPHFPALSRKALLGFWSASVLLFWMGMAFCLMLTLPYGIQFLLSFERPEIVGLISVKNFVSFCLWMVFGFGLAFELPLAMIMLARIGIVDVKTLGGWRRYAILAISVVSAVMTPTPDIFNMLLMDVPLYLLFEIGLLGMRLWGKDRDGRSYDAKSKSTL